MVRLTIVDQDGKVLFPQDIATAAELLTVAEQARTIIRECERLARQREETKTPSTAPSKVPYSS